MFTATNNLDRALSWNESYVQEFLLKKYEVTGDVVALQQFITRANKVLSLRDDVLSLANETLGITKRWPRWSEQKTTTYSINTDAINCPQTPPPLVASAGTDGMIIYPLARFAWMVKSRQLQDVSHTSNGQPYDISQTFGATANRYIVEVQRTIADHQREWNPAMSSYRWPAEARCVRSSSPAVGWDDRPLPYNLNHAMGRALIMIYLATGHRHLLVQARQLALAFHEAIRQSPYTWRYWSDQELLENVDHAFIPMDFAYLAWSNGIGLKYEDIQHLATVVQRLFPSTQSIAGFVDGTAQRTASEPKFDERAWNAPHYLMVLDESSSSTIGVIRALSDTYVATYPISFNLLGLVNSRLYTKSIAYGQSCIVGGDASCATGSCFGQGWYPSPICGYPLSYGSTCGRDGECATGSCFGQGWYFAPICGYLLGQGSTCGRDAECGSGDCDNGVCR